MPPQTITQVTSSRTGFRTLAQRKAVMDRNGLSGRGNRKNVNEKVESGNLDIFTRLNRCGPNLQSYPFYCIPALSSDNYHR